MSPPFPTVPLTVDTIIRLGDGRIVLIERRDEPHGVAIPGGFVEPGESAPTAAIREAMEETGLEISLVEVLHVYSNPGRDPRGPCASVAYIADAEGQTPKSGDDAKAIVLVTPADALVLPLVFDHKSIMVDYINWLLYRIRPSAYR